MACYERTVENSIMKRGCYAMKRLRTLIAVMTLVSLLSTASSAFASDDTLREVFTDAFYGAAIGGLVGGAIMVFQRKPLDHVNFIAYGAASGVLAGTAYGLAKSARAFAEVENGTCQDGISDNHPGAGRFACIRTDDGCLESRSDPRHIQLIPRIRINREKNPPERSSGFFYCLIMPETGITSRRNPS